MKDFEDRVLNDLLPTFCNDPNRLYDISGFKCDFAAISEIDAHNFVRALDANLVKLVGRLYRAPQSRAGEQFFWEHERNITPRPLTLWIEPIITVAALSRLHFELGWPIDLLGTQSVDWAFDVTAYLESDLVNEYVACEVKKTTKEMDKLVDLMKNFGGDVQCNSVSGKYKNAFQKIKGLRARRAPLFWAVGPGGNNVVFKLLYSEDGFINFEQASVADLRYPNSPIPVPKISN